jgi:molybdopterin synthase catalytic subunit
MTGSVTLCQITDDVIDVEAHLGAVRTAPGGAEVLFCGVVRDHDDGRTVTALEYQGHPSAASVLADVAASFSARQEVLAVAVSHRIGSLQIGDVALVAAVSTAHRGDAFATCAALVDEVKRRLPIWKRQVFADGTDEWVNCP